MASIHRFYLPPEAIACQSPALTDREAHHALDVLRLRVGSPLIVQDGAGHEFNCVIRSHSRSRVELEIKETRFSPVPPCSVTLLSAIPKGKIETIVEKATELGARRIVPLLTERTVVHLDPGNATAKVAKWQQVAIESIKQCGSPWLPNIETPQTPDQFLAQKESFDLALVASLQPGSTHLRPLFQSFQANHHRPPRSVCVWVGPEGDFTPEEYAAIQSAGAQPIRLGPLVLRADTAVVYSLSIISHELQCAS